MEERRKEVEEKYGKEVWQNMDRLAEFMARMIHKYGPELLKEMEEEKRGAGSK
ncbi:MAG: hypothetical protein IJ682_04050 [Lachnospiraceae bacterium]|nr:hypothetical protein [Lachnospiraceae bacterium]